jgi:hypothetical protein
MTEPQHANRKILPRTSYRARDGTLIEMVFDPEVEQSRLVVYQRGVLAFNETVEADGPVRNFVCGA